MPPNGRSLAPILSLSSGTCVYSKKEICIIKPDDMDMWIRYIHVWHFSTYEGERVSAGQQIGLVSAKERHLHLDMARFDLARDPENWPGDDLEFVQRFYLDPLEVISSQTDGEHGLVLYRKTSPLVRQSTFDEAQE